MSFFRFRQQVRSRTLVFFAGAGLGVVVLGVFMLAGGSRLPVFFSSHPVMAQVIGGSTGLPSVASVAERALPSVVNIATTRATPTRHPALSDPFFRRFFGPTRPAPPRQRQGLGSGVIVSADGLVVTNNHVVARAEKIKVVLSDKREFQATVVGKDPKSDLALLRLKGATGLRPIALGNSDKLRLGDVVLAIGNPFGVGQTVTMGIVSAKGRGQVGIVDYEDFIQTDAAINPGNSGGALVNMRGELVGINTAILSRSGGYQGIGFAIPTNMVKPITSSLLKHGKMVRGWLGVAIQQPTPAMARRLALPTHLGVLISDVDPRGPAGRAGLRRDDLVVKIDGKPVQTTHRLRNLVAASGAGRKISLELHRKGRLIRLKIKLGQLPSQGRRASRAPPGSPGVAAGLQVTPLTPQARRRLGIPARIRHGVVLKRVDPAGPEAAAGLRPGDVILQVNRVKIASVGQLRRVYGPARGRVLLLIHRRGHTLYVMVDK